MWNIFKKSKEKEEKKEISSLFFIHRKQIDEIIQKSILDNLPLDLDNTDWDRRPTLDINGIIIPRYYYKQYVISNKIISLYPNYIIDEETEINKYIKETEDYQRYILYSFRFYFNPETEERFIEVKIYKNDKYEILKKLD